MIEMLKKLGVPVLALGLGAALGLVAGVGCIDNSGNKTYAHGGGSGTDGGAAEVADDAAPVDAPDTDAPITDGPAAEVASTDAPVGDLAVDHAAIDGLPGDTHVDGTGN